MDLSHILCPSTPSAAVDSPHEHPRPTANQFPMVYQPFSKHQPPPWDQRLTQNQHLALSEPLPLHHPQPCHPGMPQLDFQSSIPPDPPLIATHDSNPNSPLTGGPTRQVSFADEPLTGRNASGADEPLTVRRPVPRRRRTSTRRARVGGNTEGREQLASFEHPDSSPSSSRARVGSDMEEGREQLAPLEHPTSPSSSQRRPAWMDFFKPANPFCLPGVLAPLEPPISSENPSPTSPNSTGGLLPLVAPPKLRTWTTPAFSTFPAPPSHTPVHLHITRRGHPVGHTFIQFLCHHLTTCILRSIEINVSYKLKEPGIGWTPLVQNNGQDPIHIRMSTRQSSSAGELDVKLRCCLFTPPEQFFEVEEAISLKYDLINDVSSTFELEEE